MKPALAFLISQSVAIPLLVGLARYQRVRREYAWIFLVILFGFLVEIASYILIRQFHRSNAVPCNLDVLLEWLFLALQFRSWGFLRKRKNLFNLLLGGTLAFWLTENIIFGQIVAFSPYFRLLYSFLVVLLSVNEINYMITHNKSNLFMNPKFLICLGFILYYVYKIVYEWAYQLSLYGESQFTAGIEFLFAYINALANLIYAIAFLLIPAKEKFTLA
jgi:hypothetical protein